MLLPVAAVVEQEARGLEVAEAQEAAGPERAVAEVPGAAPVRRAAAAAQAGAPVQRAEAAAQAVVQQLRASELPAAVAAPVGVLVRRVVVAAQVGAPLQPREVAAPLGAWRQSVPVPPPPPASMLEVAVGLRRPFVSSAYPSLSSLNSHPRVALPLTHPSRKTPPALHLCHATKPDSRTAMRANVSLANISRWWQFINWFASLDLHSAESYVPRSFPDFGSFAE